VEASAHIAAEEALKTPNLEIVQLMTPPSSIDTKADESTTFVVRLMAALGFDMRDDQVIPPSKPAMREKEQMTEKILLVCGDVYVLDSVRRYLWGQFTIDTASGYKEGLQMLAQQGPFAVVVADYHMSEMDGVQLLIKAKEISPDAVRMMLIRYTELSRVIEAINEGYIFRFLVKPCHPDTLIQAFQAALKQYQLINAERELLETTLARSVQLFTEILSKVNPIAFGQSLRIRRVVKRIIYNLELSDAWQFELAAILSQIGRITLPSALLEKLRLRTPLSDDEKRLFASHPMIAYKWLVDIPRIEPIPMMVRDQQRSFNEFPEDDETPYQRRAALGAQILKVAIDYESAIHNGTSHQDAVQTMLLHNQKYNLHLVNALGKEAILEKD
jgi:response regulator RpfG family c-di-GMP phosphodiesterase